MLASASSSYPTDTEVKRESASDKFMVHAIAFVDDMHREQARERTRDALRRKAERGHVAGETDLASGAHSPGAHAADVQRRSAPPARWETG